jgi:hypothetical protein
VLQSLKMKASMECYWRSPEALFNIWSIASGITTK